MATTTRLADWHLPTTLLASFTVGIALACGHHYFYSTLHDEAVEGSQWPQQTNIAIGTAFAFLVRAAFVVAISAAFWQLFWQRLQRSMNLARIDDLADQLGALHQLLNPRNLKTAPLLGGLALIAWLVPLAAVFPPATLKIVPESVPSQVAIDLQVPNYDKTDKFVASFSNVGVWPAVPDGGAQELPLFVSRWAGPATKLRRNMFSVAYQGELPSFAAPQINSSYSIEFIGPSIQCGVMANQTGILHDLNVAGVQCLNGSTTCEHSRNYYYISWVANDNVTLPRNSDEDNYIDDWNGIVPFTNGSIQGDLPDPSYIGTNPWRPEAVFVAYRANVSAKGVSSGDVGLLNCTLYNATYSVSLDFNSGKQNVTVSAVSLGKATTFLPRPPDFSSDWPGVLGINPLQVQSYLAMMQVLGELLVGSLYYYELPMTDRTHVFETELAFTEELYPLYINYTSSSDTNSSASPPKELRPLKDAIEELFQNMTLSLFNMPSLLVPQQKQTTLYVSTTYNVYKYNSERLWSAYGAAIAATFVAVVISLHSIATSRTSYSNKFSTIVRVSRDQAIDAHIQRQDRFGQDPLPKYIGEAKLCLGQQSSGERATWLPHSSSCDSGGYTRNDGNVLNESEAETKQHVRTELLRAEER